jgi:hypothetical protein
MPMKILKAVLAATLAAVVPISAQTEEAAASGGVEGILSLEQVVTDFRTDANAAEQKYGGNLLTIRGRVGVIAPPQDGVNQLSVTLQEYENPTPGVQCLFSQDAFPANSNVVIGTGGSQAILEHKDERGFKTGETPFAIVNEQVTIRGSYSEFDGANLVLQDCQLIQGE